MTVMNSFYVFDSVWEKKYAINRVFCIVRISVLPVSQSFSGSLSLLHHR